MNKLQAMELAAGLAGLVTGMETDLIQNIAAYLLAGKIESDISKWKIRKLAELGKLNQKNIETIAAYAEDEKSLAELTVKRAVVSAMVGAEKGFRRMVIEGLVKDAAEGSMDKTMANAIRLLGKQAKNDLNLVNTTMLYKAKDTASKVIYDAAKLVKRQDFLDMLNKAAGKTVTGTEAMTSAVSKCLKEMAEKGLPGFIDKRGREWTPEAYVNMCVRATVKNTETQAVFDRMKDYKLRIIEISSHAGARPKCRKDQGKLFDLDNGSGYVEDGNGNKIKYEPWSSSSYGEPDGILGINCGHSAYPFTAGRSTQTYFPYDEDESDKLYKKVQKQRELERKVRASKRVCSVLKDGDPEMFQKASVLLKQRSQALKDYCTANNLTYQNERTSVLGYGRSEAAKVTAAYNRALKNGELQLDLIKSKNKTPQNATENSKPLSSCIDKSILKIVCDKDNAAIVLDIAEKDFSLMPEKHRNILSKALKKIEITDKGVSGYSDKQKTMLLREDISEGDALHEAGHVIFHELKVSKDKKYKKILKKGLENLTNYDIIINTDYEREFYQVIGDKFINPYQARIYIDFNNVDFSENLHYSRLKEYFSEGYRAYFYEPDLLKEKDIELFNYIKELVDGK